MLLSGRLSDLRDHLLVPLACDSGAAPAESLASEPPGESPRGGKLSDFVLGIPTFQVDDFASGFGAGRQPPGVYSSRM